MIRTEIIKEEKKDNETINRTQRKNEGKAERKKVERQRIKKENT
jgi:hypothetical protein